MVDYSKKLVFINIKALPNIFCNVERSAPVSVSTVYFECILKYTAECILPLVVSTWQTWVCTIPGAQLLGSPARIQRDIRADCFRSCELHCCRAECILLRGSNVQPDIFAVMIAWL